MSKDVTKIDDLLVLIQNGESEKLEFKKSSATLKSAAETLCAFLNDSGGVVLIGVTDDKKIVGQHITDQTQLEIANTLRKFEPTANIQIQYLDIGAHSKQVIMLRAHPDHRLVPYTFDGRAYERNSSATHLMPQTKYQQLLLARNLTPVSWESQIATGVSIDDLDEKEIRATIRDINQQKRFEGIGVGADGVVDILTRLKLIKSGQVTNAAVILFAKEIPGDYLQCVIRMVRFRGIKKKVDFIDSKHIFGNAFQLLNEAESFINRNTSITSRIEDGKFARIDEPEYPFKAIREALINALVHRDYTSRGGSVTVSIYDDRLEIANTGILLPDVTLEDLKITHTSHPRNPEIINVFFRRGYIEALGIGTQEIIQSCISANMKQPDFYEQAGTFVVRLWSKHYREPILQEMYWEELSAREIKIVEILKANKRLAPHEILGQLGMDITDRTLRNDLQGLKEKGYVETEGRGPKTRWFFVHNNPENNRK